MRNQTWQLIGVILLAVATVGTLNHTVLSQAPRQAAAQHEHAAGDAKSRVTKAIAVVQPLGDSGVKGKVTFTKKKGGVEIMAELSGLEPGEHGFHVHEFGDCSMDSGECAGGHFNPTGAPHGGPDDEERHAGDFGNIKADQSGKATYKRVDKMIKLNGPKSIVGRAVIVHAGRDDLKSQPSGDAGGRIACGVIGIADPKMQH
jgi:superoxide dismutase, Cu-Zn family